MSDIQDYRIEGSYYEACNCDAICPCRRQGDVLGGRSTYGVCDFLLSWKIKRGNFGKIDLSELGVVMAGTYSDDEKGSPWSVYLYVDENASDDQLSALSAIFRGESKGNILFIGNISKVLGIKRARIELVHTAGAETLLVSGIASANAVRNFEFDGVVSCGIPGHDHPGQESVSNLAITDAPLDWRYEERCGFATDFAYWN